MSGAKEEATKRFKARQREASQRVAVEEERMFAASVEQQAADAAAGKPAAVAAEHPGVAVTSPLSASVWKMLVEAGDVIESDEMQVIELEAMKTSFWVVAGDGMKGKKVTGIVVAHGDSWILGPCLCTLGDV